MGLRWLSACLVLLSSSCRVDPALGAVCDPPDCVVLADGTRECDRRIQKFHPSLYQSIDVAGVQRTYLLHVPACAADGRKLPVIFNLHGGGGNGETAETAMGGFNQKAEEKCFIAVHPNGRSAHDTEGRLGYWNGGDALTIPEIDPTSDDVGFISTLIDRLVANHQADPRRIFATGISNGAWMTHRLGCELSDKIAAIAPIAGGPAVSTCAPTRPVSVLHLHGTADPGWPFEGGNACFTDTTRAPANEVVAGWRTRNTCADVPLRVDTFGQAVCTTYGCAAGSEVRACIIEGGGHTIPGGCAYAIEQQVAWDSDCALGKGRGVGKVSTDLSAPDAMWEFFLSHPMP